MDFTVSRLPYTATAHLWQEYANAIGLEALHNAYGSHWPRPMLDDEAVFEFRIPTCGGQDSDVIAWGSMLWEPTERITLQSHGMFPQYQKQNITPQITRWLRAWAFTHTPCVAVCCKILDTNAFYQKWMRENHQVRGWQFAGHISLPAPGYDMYSFDRETWEAREAS